MKSSGPTRLILMRHALSETNHRCMVLKTDPLYLEFKMLFEKEPFSERTKKFALTLHSKYQVHKSDADTPLADGQEIVLRGIGEKLHNFFMGDDFPDVVILSPYLRARQTFNLIKEGCSHLESVPIVIDEQVVEQNHGDVHHFLSWKIFGALHPEKHRLFLENGHYDFPCPQGESTREMQHRRIKPFLSYLSQRFVGRRVFILSHALFILATKCEVEGSDKEGFEVGFKAKKPNNCSLTCFKSGDVSTHPSGLILTEFDLVL